MSTPYEKVYQAFLDKLSDYDLPLIDEQTNDAMLLRYLKASCSKFQRVCQIDLNDKDDLLAEFNGDLSEEEIDIITEYMVVKWWEPRKNNSELLQDFLGSKDYRALHSPANLLSEVRKSYQDCKDEHTRLIREYSVANGRISDLKVR